MHVPYKGNGGLILVYLLMGVIISGLLARYLSEKGIAVDDNLIMGLTLLLTAIATYLTKDVFIKDKEGNKIKVDFYSSFFFIQMKYWVYIFLIGAFVLFVLHFYRMNSSISILRNSN